MSPLKGSVTPAPCLGWGRSVGKPVSLETGGSPGEAGGGPFFTHAFGRGLASHTSFWAGPGFVFIGGNGPLHWRNFRIVFLIVLHAVKKMCSISAGRIQPCSSTEENCYLQIRSCFVFHFLHYDSSWLLFPCESTFILKLLP